MLNILFLFVSIFSASFCFGMNTNDLIEKATADALTENNKKLQEIFDEHTKNITDMSALTERIKQLDKLSQKTKKFDQIFDQKEKELEKLKAAIDKGKKELEKIQTAKVLIEFAHTPVIHPRYQPYMTVKRSDRAKNGLKFIFSKSKQ